MDDYISDAYELSVLRAENERLKKQVEILTKGLKFYKHASSPFINNKASEILEKSMGLSD